MNDSIRKVISKLSKHPDVHTVYWGFKKVCGITTEEECVVCEVEHKLPLHEVLIPIASQTGFGGIILTDVVERKPPKIELLRINKLTNHTDSYPQAGEDHRRCFSPTVPGGAQISPAGAGWVGTHGAACKSDGKYGSLSNWHVLHGGIGAKGTLINQPLPASGTIGRLVKWVRINFSGQDNRVDAGWFSSRDGFEKTYLTIPEQIGLGRINPDSERNPRLKMRVVKSGRTTGVVKTGRVTGINVITNVNYGAGKTAKFVDQVMIENDGQGDFSGPGDSGSLILTEDMRPLGLLFAGGNGATIANPIELVERELGIRFF